MTIQETAPARRAVSNGEGLGIQRRMVQLGKLRMGDKGPKGEPRKLSKWRLTSASRPLLEAAARLYGGTVRAWQGAPDDGMWELLTTSEAIDVMVPPTMNAYSQYYEDWSGGTCNVRCDGRWDAIAEKACDHDHANGNAPSGLPWRVTTRVSVILPKLPGLGTWGLETHGWNAASTLPATLDLIGATGAWIRAVVRLEQRSSRKRDPKTNKVLVQRFVVPVLDLAGASFEELLAGGQAAYVDAPALGAGPGSLALPPGPTRPPATRVPRPEMAPEPPLDDETEAFAAPVSKPFPDEAPPVNAAAEPAAEAEVVGVATPTLAKQLLDVAASAKTALHKTPANDEQRDGLAELLGPVGGPVIFAGVRAVWPDAIGEDNRAHLSQAEAAAVLVVGEQMGVEPFREAWKAMATEARA